VICLFPFDFISGRMNHCILDGFLLARLNPDRFEVAFKEASVFERR
jgi:hypothetical protein